MEGISLPHDHGQTMEQELEHMPSTENFQTVADVFKQLSDGSRIRIQRYADHASGGYGGHRVHRGRYRHHECSVCIRKGKNQ